MPTYSVRGPDGYLYNINGPEGASEDDIISAAQKFARERAVAEANKPEPETTTLGHAKEFFKGIPSGALGLAQSVGTGISALLPENVEKGARETLAKVGKDFGEPFAPEAGYEDTVSRKLGEGLGSTLPFFALGPLGTAGRAASVGIAAAAGAGEARERAEAEGATGGDRALATFLGIGPGMLDVVAPELRWGKSIISRALTSGGLEGATEAAQQVAQNLISKGIYNPDQGAFADVLESGGYGAGTGALASMLVDMVAGKHAKIKGAQAERAQQKLAQERYTPGTTPEGPMAQGNLFTEETAPAAGKTGAGVEGVATSAAPTAEGVAPSAAPETAPTPTEPGVVEAQKEAAPPEAQGQLDLSTGQTVEQQIEELYRQEEEVKAREDLTQAEKDLEVAKLKMASDIAETDAKVQTGEVKAKEAERIEALRQVIEEPKIKNIPKLFSQYLVSLGYNKDTPFTPREQNLINRAIDVQLAQPEVEEITTPVDVAAQNAEMEARIPEKGAKPTPQGQLPLEGIPKAKPSEVRAAEEAKMAEAQATAEAAPVGETMTGEILDGFGLGPRMPIRQRIVGKSLVDPAERTLVRGELAELAVNPNIKAPVRAAIKNYINSDIFRTQPDMFTKKGEVRKATLPPTAEQIQQRKAEYAAKQEAEKQARADRAKKAAETRKAKKEAESAVARVEPTTTGVSTEGTVGERGQRRTTTPSAARTEAPKAAGLGNTKRVSDVAGRRTRAPQPAVKETREEREAKEQKVALNEWQESLEKLTKTSSGPTLAEILAARKTKKLEGAIALAPDVAPEIQSQLKSGDLKGALSNLAGKLDGIAGRITRQLANAIGDTKVEVVENLKDEAGKPVAGLFDPSTNTIKLDSKAGVSSHTVIHEAVHAATSHVLDNKSHPVTRQLQALYDSVKDSLDTAYGAQSLDEFVAEAFGNPEFQAKLNAINPKGEPITAWQRFSNTIQNFLRRMVGMEPTGLTSFDKADELISAILSPSPETRDAGSLYMKSLLGKGGEWLNNMAKGRDVLPKEPNLDAYHEFFTGTVKGKFKEALRGALPLNALVDVAKKYIPMAPMVDKLVNQKSASESKRNDQLHNSIMDVSRWSNKQTEVVMKAFNNTVYNSTIDQVDPSKPRESYKGDAEKLKLWDAAQADWKAIGPEGQSMYKMMRDTYKGMYDEIQRILGIRIDESMADPATSKKIKAEIYKRLAERGGLEPYFPLTRTGKYWLSYHAFDPRTKSKELYVEAFESSRARDRAMEELKTNGAEEIQKFSNFKDISYRSAPPTSFANSVLKTLEANKVDAETTEQVMRLFLDTLPETSFAQAFRQRKGTLGFETDAVKAFKMKAHSISRQLSNMEYGAKLASLKREIAEYVKTSGSQEATVQFADELGKRIDFAMSPNVPYWSKVATSIGFNMTLGFNLSSALVNLTQIPLVTMPYLGGKYGFSETARAMGRAAKVFTNSGTERMVETYVPTESGSKTRKVKAFWSLDNYDFSKHPELKHLQTLSDIAGDMGQLNRSQIYDVLDVDESDSMLSKVNAASGLIFHHGERMNRQVSLIAAYELELQRLVGKGKDIKKATKEQMEQAAHEAIYLTELTNGGVAAAAAPRLAQSGVGKVAFMFKRYGVSMYYMMFKTAREALKGADPEVRKQAMKQIAGIYGSSALIAGVRGIPMFGIAAMIFNMFRDDDEDDFETSTRKWIGETMYKGPVNALTGLEIAGRVGLSDLIFRDQSYNKDQTAVQSLMEQAGGPVLGVANRVERGLSLIGEGDVQRGVEQMLPSAIGNGLKAFRYATEGTQTLRGDPVTGEVGPWNVFAQAFGFAPAEYIQQLERNAAVKKIDRKVNEERTKMLRQYYIALRESDGSAQEKIYAKMQEFSRKHPGAAISGETIKNSMAQHHKTSATMYHGITISKNMRPELMRNIAEYDDEE